MPYFISAMLIVSGIIHLMPLPGALGDARLSALYGMPFEDPDLLLLMRHRAILFGLLGALLVTAAFVPSLQPLALVSGLVSVVSFLALALPPGAFNGHVQRIFAVDVVALVCLLAASAAWIYLRYLG